MARWFSKRWVWAALAGTTVAIGLATGRPDGEGPPKVGAVINLNIDGKGDRQFKVIKSDRQPDGTYLSELKDTKTGETITLVDKPGGPAPAGTKAPEPPKGPAPSKAPQPTAAPMPDPAKDSPKEKEKRPILGRIFGDKDKTPAAPAMPAAEMPGDPGKKSGLFSRVFGPKKPTGPSMPAPTTGPVVRPSPSTPPAVIPTPPGGVTGAPNPNLPPFPVTGGPSGPGSTAEPPRVMPTKPVPMPVAPPMPTVPTPLPPPTAPSFPTPAPLPIPMPSAPAFPVPSVPTPMPATPTPVPVPLPAPTVPAPAGGSSLPPIPTPSGGTSATKPLQVVVPAGYVPAGIAFDRDVQPFVIALQTMDAPSARLTAAKGLADCRHASSDGVKAVLFQAAQMDPCAEVRAACIEHLCKLGYFSPHFLGYIQSACEDVNPMVSAAAKAACAKMIRK
jgi:hypothetical protein